MELVEGEYIHQLKSGSRKSFDALYRMYASRIYSYCYQYTKSYEDAEEVVQDVFVKLWSSRESIRKEDTIKYWLLLLRKIS